MALSYRTAVAVNRAFPHTEAGNLVPMMDTSRAAELQALLEGVALPAEKSALLEYAVRQRAEPYFIAALRSLPEKQYESLDEVGEELVHVQPSSEDEPEAPHEESGAPPGGDAYTDQHPDTGQVRDLDQVEGGDS